jgi:DNA-directed RNA polymerase subunit RPC12/RpoP
MTNNYSKNKHCKCGKLISNNANKCLSCAKKELLKNPMNNPNYNDGRSINNTCLDCGKKSKRQTIRCNECENKHHSLLMKGTRNFMYGRKGVSKNKIVKHHIDLNKKNNLKENILPLRHRIHTSLHARAYRYLVMTGQVKNYISWFFKIGKFIKI